MLVISGDQYGGIVGIWLDYRDVTRASWRLKSLAIRLFVQGKLKTFALLPFCEKNLSIPPTKVQECAKRSDTTIVALCLVVRGSQLLGLERVSMLPRHHVLQDPTVPYFGAVRGPSARRRSRSPLSWHHKALALTGQIPDLYKWHCSSGRPWNVRVQMKTTLCFHLKLRTEITPTLSLVAPQDVVTTTCGATTDDKVGILTTVGFHSPNILYEDFGVRSRYLRQG